MSDAHTESDAIATLSWGDVDIVVIEEPWNRAGSVLRQLMNTEDAPALVRVGRGTEVQEAIAEDGPAIILLDKLSKSWGETLSRAMLEHKLTRFLRRAARGEAGRLDAASLQVGDVLTAAKKIEGVVHLALEGARGKGVLNVLSANCVDLRYGAAVGHDALFLAHLVPPSWLVSLAQAPSSRAPVAEVLGADAMLGELGKRWPQWLRLAPAMPALDAVVSVSPGVQIPSRASACLRNPTALAENLMHVDTEHLDVLRAVSELHTAGNLRIGVTVPPASSALRGGMPYRRATLDTMAAVRPSSAGIPKVVAPVSSVASPPSVRAAAKASSEAPPVRGTLAPTTVAQPAVVQPKNFRGTLMGFGSRVALDGALDGAPAVVIVNAPLEPPTPPSEPAAMNTVSVPAAVPLREILRSEVPSSGEEPQTARSQSLAATSGSELVSRIAPNTDLSRPTMSAPPAGSTPRLPENEPSVVVLASVPPSSRTSGIVRDVAAGAARDANVANDAALATSRLLAPTSAPPSDAPAPVDHSLQAPNSGLGPGLAALVSEAPFERTRGAMMDTFVSERKAGKGPLFAIFGGSLLVAALAGGWKLHTMRAAPAAPEKPVVATSDPAPLFPAPVTEASAVVIADAAAPMVENVVAAEIKTVAPADTRPLWTHRELEVALDRGLQRRVVEEGLRLVAVHPDDALVWEMLGVAYKSQGKRDEAKQAFKTCAEHAKGNARAECLAFGK